MRKAIRIGLWIVLLAVMLQGVMAVDCGVAIKDCECGDTLKTNYVMSSDLSCSADALIIGNTDLILDCNGYTIDGNGLGVGVDVRDVDADGVTIRNCNIRDFSRGIYIASTDNHSIHNNTFFSDLYGIDLRTTYNNNITNNTITSSDSYGIYITSTYSNNIINNTILSSGTYGIYTSSNVVNNNISYNNITDSESHDIYLYSTGSCNNYIENNQGTNGLPIGFYNSTVNLADETYSELILCDADYSTVHNITITGSESLNNMFAIIGTDYANITNITSTYTTWGIYLRESDHTNISDSTLQDNDYGIYGHFSDYARIHNNVMNNNNYGLHHNRLEYAHITDNSIKSNAVMDISYDASVLSQCTTYFNNNLITDDKPLGYYNTTVNIQDAAYGLLILCNADNSVIDNVTIAGSSSLRNNLMYMTLIDNAIIKNSNFSNTEIGLHTYQSHYNNISNNQFYNADTTGLKLAISNNNNISYNSFKEEDSYGIYLDNADTNTISNNTFSNENTGLYNFYSQFNSIEGNTIDGTIVGINLYGTSTDNNITRNVISTGNIGIYTHHNSVKNNTFVENTITNNYEDGIRIRLGANNTFTDNIACNNNQNVGSYYDIDNESSYPQVFSGNACDTPNPNGLCDTTCQEALCLNGVIDPGEECSDGNLANGDGCSSTCKLECGATITSDVTLTQDLHNSTGGTVCGGSGLLVGAHDVTIDCAGFSINGNGSTVWGLDGIHSNAYDGITLRNCNINSFNAGILFITGSDNGLIENNNITNNHYGVIVYASSKNNTITNNNASNNQDGIRLESNANDNYINYNTLNNNNNGIYLLSSSNNNTITHNNATNNNNGIYLQSSSNNNTITHNNATNNNHGIVIQDANSSTLTHNNANNNTNTGIIIIDANDNTLTHNNATNNNRDGILITGNILDNTIASNNVCYNNQINSAHYDINNAPTTSQTFTDNSCDTKNAQGLCEYTCDGKDWLSCEETVTASHLNGIRMENSTAGTICPNQAFETGANNLVIDCKGETITGNNAGTAILVQDDNIELRNCALDSFTKGVDVSGFSSGTTLSNINVSNSGSGIEIGIATTGTTLTNAFLTANTQGLYVLSVNNDFTAINVTNSQESGVKTGVAANDNTFTDIYACNNNLSGSNYDIWERDSNTWTTVTCDTSSPSMGICDLSCVGSVCGDGIVEGSETCDDSNAVTETCTYGQTSCTVCDSTCQNVAGATSYCGDSNTDGLNGENCDDGGESATCDADCTAVSCGDGTTNTAAGETCDGAGETALCNIDCTTAVCGDGYVNTAAGEACDDGGTASGDGCDASCMIEQTPPTLGDWNNTNMTPSNIPDYNLVTGFGVGNEHGSIVWNDPVNLSGLIFPNNVLIGNNSIYLNSAVLANLSQSANLTIYHSNLTQPPTILVDGVVCTTPQCTNVDTAGDLSHTNFTVTGFSEYVAGANAQLETWADPNPVVNGAYTEFLANYTKTADDTSIIPGTPANCNINVSDVINAMDYDTGRGLYNFTDNYSLGPYLFNITCSGTGFETLSTQETLQVVAAFLGEDNLTVTYYQDGKLIANVTTNETKTTTLPDTLLDIIFTSDTTGFQVTATGVQVSDFAELNITAFPLNISNYTYTNADIGLTGSSKRYLVQEGYAFAITPGNIDDKYTIAFPADSIPAKPVLLQLPYDPLTNVIDFSVYNATEPAMTQSGVLTFANYESFSAFLLADDTHVQQSGGGGRGSGGGGGGGGGSGGGTYMNCADPTVAYDCTGFSLMCPPSGVKTQLCTVNPLCVGYRGLPPPPPNRLECESPFLPLPIGTGDAVAEIEDIVDTLPEPVQDVVEPVTEVAGEIAQNPSYLIYFIIVGIIIAALLILGVVALRRKVHVPGQGLDSTELPPTTSPGPSFTPAVSEEQKQADAAVEQQRIAQEQEQARLAEEQRIAAAKQAAAAKLSQERRLAGREGIRELERFIYHGLAKGFSYQTIKEVLQEKGWPDDLIDDVFNHCKFTDEHIEKESLHTHTNIDYAIEPVKNLLAKGFDEEHIRQGLRRKGWSEEYIDEIFSRL